MTKLLPGEPLIYERVDGVVFAKYRDKPEIPRWVIGGDPEALSRFKGELFSWSEYQEMMQLSLEYPALKSQMKKLLDIYYLCKDNKK